MRIVNLSEIVNNKYVCNSTFEDVIMILIYSHTKKLVWDEQIINIDISRQSTCANINEIVHDYHNVT